MKIRNILLPFALTIGAASSVHALPITYDFTAIYAPDMGLGPYPLISGSFTLDGTAVTGIDLTIGSHTYSTNEVGYALQNDGSDLIGGIVDYGGDIPGVPGVPAPPCGINCVAGGTNDFYLVGKFSQNLFVDFVYASPGVEGPPITYTGTITARPSNVPVPGSFALFASGIVGLFSIFSTIKRSTCCEHF